MSQKFNVYIDEAGDEGFTVRNNEWKSSKWFVVGAIIVPDIEDKKLASVINEIKHILKVKPEDMLKPLHFAKLSHKKKRVAVNEIAKRNGFTSVIVAIDKQKIYNDSALKNEKQYLYNYCTRFLLERVSWFVDEKNGLADLVFENRSNISYNQLDKYMESLLNDPQYEIRPNIISSWKTLNKSQSKNLQVADCVVSSVFAALEEDEFGYSEPSYLKVLSSSLYRRRENLFSYGFKLFPLSGNDHQLKERYKWLDELS